MTNAEFVATALSNPANAALLARLRSLALPDCHLTAGCLFQTVWNRFSGRSAEWGIKDYDVFYYDEDVSWDAEDRVICRVAEATADLGVTVEVRNQARVHLWYPARFGRSYPHLASARDGIDRYLIACTCVGIEVASGTLYATYGLQELACGVLRPNPLNPHLDLFVGKARSYRARWPWLTIVADAAPTEGRSSSASAELPPAAHAGTTSNARTLATYEDRIAEYVAGTSHDVAGASKDWIDAALAGLPPDARILEIGSGFGRDAAYMRSKGYDPECSDATEGFLPILRDKGFRARRFDALADELPGAYELILANAVLLHFTAEEFAVVLAKLHRALAPGGRLAFSLKQGEGEAWSAEKMGAPRFFRYWQPEALEPVLAAAAFGTWTIGAATTDRAHPQWLHVIATAR